VKLSITVSAQVSVYPLRREHLGLTVGAVREKLEAYGLRPWSALPASAAVGTVPPASVPLLFSSSS
jgi:hypothetical protein